MRIRIRPLRGTFIMAVTVVLAGAAAAQPQPLAEDFLKGEAMRILIPADTGSFFNGVYPLDEAGMAELPVVGRIVIAGKTRENVERYLGDVWAPYLRDTHIFAKPVIRVAVLGNVKHPGFYYVPQDEVIWDVIHQAGGPPQPRKIEEAAHLRAGEEVNGSLIRAITERRTLREAGIRSGDAIVLPIPPERTNVRDVLQMTSSVLSILVSGLTVYVLLNRD